MNLIDDILKRLARLEAVEFPKANQIYVTAGENIAQGEICRFSQATNSRVLRSAVNEDMPVGVAMADVLNGAKFWVAISGLAYVKFKGGVAGTHGYIAYASDTAGLADCAASVPADPVHFREIGHVYTDGAAGGLALCVLHFN